MGLLRTFVLVSSCLAINWLYRDVSLRGVSITSPVLISC
jgi:hypothetical protein